LQSLSEPSDDAVDGNMGDINKEYGLDVCDEFVDATHYYPEDCVFLSVFERSLKNLGVLLKMWCNEAHK
jgi:hypothetical protein